MKYQNRDQWNIRDPRVIAAFDAVPRQEFVPREHRSSAGEDNPLSIGYGQTISQPFMVAYMTEALGVDPTHKVLELGTGSGFQTAVLYQLSKQIYTIERIPQLAEEAARRFEALGYAGIELKTGSGRAGWPEEAPFDRIMVTAAPLKIPEALVKQLAPGGRMIIPVGAPKTIQKLLRIEKDETGALRKTELMAVSFVPLV